MAAGPGPAASIASPISDSVMPNFEPPAPTARPASVSGATSGIDPVEDIDRWRGRSPGEAGQGGRLVDRLEGHPGAAGAPSAAARTAARRSAWVLPIPSSEIRSFGTPARRASVHSPRDTTFAPNPRAVTAAITAGTSLALTEYCRTIGSGNASRTAAAASSSVARSVTKSGVP